MKITKEYLGKRLLIKKSTAYYIEPTEANLLEVSPSGDYLKIEFVRNDSTTYTDWVNVHNYQLVEDLGYRVYKTYKPNPLEGGQVSSKDYSDCYTITNEQYEKESRKALKKELKKNNWVHGICNPPSPDWAKSNVGHDGASSVNPKKYSEWLNKNK